MEKAHNVGTGVEGLVPPIVLRLELGAVLQLDSGVVAGLHRRGHRREAVALVAGLNPANGVCDSLLSEVAVGLGVFFKNPWSSRQ